MKNILEKIKTNRTAILTIVIVAVLSIIGMNALIGYLYNVQQIQYGEQLLSDPCSLCIDCSIKAPRLNINDILMPKDNNSLNCVGPVQPWINKSHFRNTCDEIPI